MTADIAAIDYQ